MSSKKTCYTCKPPPVSESTTTPADEPTCGYCEEVKQIWAKKMEESRLFLPSEINAIVSIWAKFICKRLSICRTSNAEVFYVETAVAAANNLKNFDEDGWQCFMKEYSIAVLRCSEESLRPVQKDSKSVSSAESIVEFPGQVEFLLQLVASSNFGFNLVKTALDPSFEQNFIRLQSPQIYSQPVPYLKLKEEELDREKMKKGLLNGVYDDYILPLQIANEVTDEFWEELEYYQMEEEEEIVYSE